MFLGWKMSAILDRVHKEAAPIVEIELVQIDTSVCNKTTLLHIVSHPMHWRDRR
jgi:hypothetical protein